MASALRSDAVATVRLIEQCAKGAWEHGWGLLVAGATRLRTDGLWTEMQAA